MKTVIEMAREAGFAVNEKARQHQPNCIFHTQYMIDELLERFAALVRAPLQERIQDLYKQLNEAERELDSQYKLGAETEREACAKIAEYKLDNKGLTAPNSPKEWWNHACQNIRDAIRARGDT